MKDCESPFEFNRLDDLLGREDELILRVKRNPVANNWTVTATVRDLVDRSYTLTLDGPPLADHLAWAIERLPEVSA